MTAMKRRSVLLTVVISLVICVLIASGGYLAWQFSKVQKAEKALLDKNYESAIEIFSQLPESRYTEQKISSAYVAMGGDHYADGDYLTAIDYFEKAHGYGDSGEYISNCYYNLGILSQTENDYIKAIEYFTLADGYENSAEKISQCYYSIATDALDANDFDLARENFSAAGDYKDAKKKLVSCDYYEGHHLFIEGNYEEAKPFLEKAAEISADIKEYRPHFENFTEAEGYLREQADCFSSEIEFYVGQLPFEDVTKEDLLGLMYNYMPISGASITYNDENKLFMVNPNYYPGHRIAYYHKTQKENFLSETGLQAYNKALSVVEEAKANSQSDFELELYLHDWICNNTVYYSPEEAESESLWFRNCFGVLVDGKANCQGYADAFYLLSTLAGFETRIIGSQTHAWNTIYLDDKWYVVDATYNDLAHSTSVAKQYIWFNVPHGTEDHDPVGSIDLFPWMFTEKDYSMTYYNVNGYIFNDAYSAVDSLARQNIYSGHKWTYVMIEGKEISKNTLSSALKSILDRYYTGYITWYEYHSYVDGNTYFTVYWMN